jgi:predicted dehydrogenase
LSQLDELLATAADRGLVLTEDHNYRFNVPMLRLEELVANGALGEVMEVDVSISAPQYGSGSRYADANMPSPSHRMPAGFIHEFVTHLAYLTLRFLPAVDTVDATWSRRHPECLSPWDDLVADVTGKGVAARISFSAVTGPNRIHVRVAGTAGWAEVDLAVGSLIVNVPRRVCEQLSPLANQFLNGAALIRSSATAFVSKVGGKGGYEGMHTFLGRTYDSLRSGAPMPVGPDDMRSVGDLVDKLIECGKS